MAKLPDLPMSSTKNADNKFRKSQPFWNEELEGYWKEVCKTEKEYLKFKVSSNVQLTWKNQLRLKYKEAEKNVENKFRYFKRLFKKKDFEVIFWILTQVKCGPN